MTWKFAWISCSNPSSPTPALDLIRRHDVRFLHLQGDTPYMWLFGTKDGVTSTQITKTSVAADFALHHAQSRAQPDWAAYIAWASANGRPIYYMPDDHEWGGDNWDHTMAQANNASFNLGTSTQAEVNFHWKEGMLGALGFMTDNLPNTDGVAIGDIPSQALVGDSPPASNYPITYFRVGYDANGNVVGENPVVEFFVVDCMSYRSPIAATDDASKTMLGATQKAWLKANVVSSNAVFKPILSNKKLTRNTGSDNADTWGFYTTERDEILTHFDSNSVTTAPWLVGDRHVPNVAQLLKTSGDAADALCVCACPVGITNNIGTMDYSSSHVWLAKYGEQTVNCFGLGIVDSDSLTLQIRGVVDDSILWQGTINAGSSVVQYPGIKIG